MNDLPRSNGRQRQQESRTVGRTRIRKPRRRTTEIPLDLRTPKGRLLPY
jgi:hypothetical protein